MTKHNFRLVGKNFTDEDGISHTVDFSTNDLKDLISEAVYQALKKVESEKAPLVGVGVGSVLPSKKAKKSE